MNKDYRRGYFDALAKVRLEMYAECFEKDNDVQKWDSGCWLRYKLFEDVMDRISDEMVMVIKDE